MKEFIRAALPFVLAGLAVVVICAGTGGARAKKCDKGMENRIAAGMVFGLAIGIALDSCGIFDASMLGLTLGPLWGMAIAVLSGGSARRGADEKQNEKRGNTPCNTEKK